jgi:hypothetical protein
VFVELVHLGKRRHKHVGKRKVKYVWGVIQ